MPEVLTRPDQTVPEPSLPQLTKFDPKLLALTPKAPIGQWDRVRRCPEWTMTPAGRQIFRPEPDQCRTDEVLSSVTDIPLETWSSFGLGRSSRKVNKEQI